MIIYKRIGYNHLSKSDTKLNTFNSLFRKSDSAKGEKFCRWYEAGKKYFITKERLIFHVGHWELIISERLIEEFLKETGEEVYSISNNTIVNVVNRTIIHTGVTKKVAKKNKGEVPTYWLDLVTILRDKKIDLGNHPLASAKQVEGEKRYRNLSKLIKKLTKKSLVTKRNGIMEIKDVKKL